jgi:hypothetical protein
VVEHASSPGVSPQHRNNNDDDFMHHIFMNLKNQMLNPELNLSSSLNYFSTEFLWFFRLCLYKLTKTVALTLWLKVLFLQKMTLTNQIEVFNV